ncbi:MAG: DUF2938 domain-containing protein [Pseudolabrys sp.]
MEMIVRAMAIGVGATLVMDLWGLLLKRGFSVRGLDYAMVGRWLGHMPAGRFVHASIVAASPVRGERALGWVAHYGTGIVFAGLLLAICGNGWARLPTALPALLVGLTTVAAPFLLMQPGMGLGIAASRTPSPNMARLRSGITHLVFGLGLYAAAWAVARFDGS